MPTIYYNHHCLVNTLRLLIFQYDSLKAPGLLLTKLLHWSMPGDCQNAKFHWNFDITSSTAAKSVTSPVTAESVIKDDLYMSILTVYNSVDLTFWAPKWLGEQFPPRGKSASGLPHEPVQILNQIKRRETTHKGWGWQTTSPWGTVPWGRTRSWCCCQISPWRKHLFYF